jgi:hypothetical protein
MLPHKHAQALPVSPLSLPPSGWSNFILPKLVSLDKGGDLKIRPIGYEF